jgi:hypothetical protein
LLHDRELTILIQCFPARPLAFAPEPQRDGSLADAQAPQRDVGQPVWQVGTHREPVVRRVRVESGLSDAEWRRLRQRLDATRLPEKPRQVEADITPDVWVEPRAVLEVLAGGITRSPRHTAGKTGHEPGYALRFPRIVRIRDDRRPEDATTEAELVELAQLARRAAHAWQDRQ